jgi:hypothetical protein
MKVNQSISNQEDKSPKKPKGIKTPRKRKYRVFDPNY